MLRPIFLPFPNNQLFMLPLSKNTRNFFHRSPRTSLVYISLTAFLLSAPTQADQDTELRLNQDLDLTSEQREQQLLEDERAKDQPLPNLIVDGQEYEVRHNRNDLGRALYVALNNRNWPVAARFLAAYRTLENPDPMLLHYAQGKLARLRGNLVQAEGEYRALLALKKDFLPGRLELARVLFENHNNREALQRFASILQDLPTSEAHTLGVRHTVNTFLQALEQRRSWQGRIAYGTIYSDNINVSSGSETCLIWFDAENCYINRTVPSPIEAGGTDFEVALEKSLFLPGHGSLQLKALAYGDRYSDHGQYNQSTYIANTGYQYRDARDQYAAGPLYEYADAGNKSLYHAWGGFAEWMHFSSPATAFKLRSDYKQMRYRREAHTRFDGGMTSLRATAWHRLGTQWTLFGGLDAVDRNAEEAVSGYEQYGARLGLAAPLWGWGDMTLFASLRHKRYDEYNALLEARREDLEQRYTAILRAPRMTFFGVIPSLTLEHTRIRSNVDWLYSYRENVASLKFERRF